jgi:DNA polymerase-3 subunit alpha
VAIEQKEYQSYFLVVADLVAWAKTKMLVGPARGSSAGSLLCYLAGITEVDPIPHGLLFERFIDLTRKDLPDIDIDFNDNKRELLCSRICPRNTERATWLGSATSTPSSRAL